MLSCLAPMDGITDCAYRIICKEIFDKYKHPKDSLLLRTEFMSADGYIHNPLGVVKHLLTSDYARPLIAQIFGGNKDSLLACAKDLDTRYHFEGIELNMGCPSPKIYHCFAGSGMLKDKNKTLDIIKTISTSINTPFSIKTRIGLNKEDKEHQMSFLIATAPYVDKITIHGRTYSQSHAGEVDRSFIYELKRQLPYHIIIGNGGLRSYQQAKEQQQNLDGMMRGQSAIGNPWILTPHIPDYQEIHQTMIHHLNLMMLCELFFEEQKSSRSGTLANVNYHDLLIQEVKITNILQKYTYQRKSPVEFRKYLFCYTNGLPNNKILKQQVAQVKDYNTLVRTIDEYFDTISY